MRTVIPKSAKLIPDNAECVFKGVMFDVYHWQQKQFDGSNKTFEMIKRQDSIKVIAVIDDEIVVLKEQQPGTGNYYELPGGRHDVKEETELQAAKREVLEETGYVFADWKLVNVEQLHPHIDYLTYTFVATNLREKRNQKLDSGERVTVQLCDFNEFRKRAEQTESIFMAQNILRKVGTLQEMLNLPEYSDL